MSLFTSNYWALSDSAHAQEWKIAGDRIISKFAKDLDPKNPLPEYPRPQMVRENWKNLNGLWDYAITPKNQTQPENFDGKILVPFAVESALSGVGKWVGKYKELWYHRTFEIPKDAAWDGKRVLLHFGGVDWRTTVYVNGKEVGMHEGGHTPFCFDVTKFLDGTGSQTLAVKVWDPTSDGFQPRGKQVVNPHGIWYMPVTGIWQTVWLEAVPETFIDRLKMVPSVTNKTLTLETFLDNVQEGDEIRATASFDSKSIANETKKAGERIVLNIAEPELWTPDTPNLYDLEVSLVRGGMIVDSIRSYFGMREVRIGKDEKGINRMLLNGKFVFQHGPLDQGWWPDGLYTAPTDEALAYDVVMTKKFGYNMLRKHIKVEPARLYYHCDRLGVLVWQDMPSGDDRCYIGPGTKNDAVRYAQSAEIQERELARMIEVLYNVPSIIVWVPFNEGWGQYDTNRVLRWTKELDPTRLVDGPSGWVDRDEGDMIDMHAYRGPGMYPVPENRASVLGEYGGLGLPVEGHLWVKSDKNWGYGGNLKNKDDLLNTYAELNRKMHPMIARGLSAAVYTQTTDVEVEVNGLMTYDREIVKVDVEKFREVNEALRFPAPEVVAVLPNAVEKSTDWSYTFSKPEDSWAKSDFDDASWKTGKSGFGRGVPGTKIGTNWDGSDIWLRKSFTLSEEDMKNAGEFLLDIFYDEDVEVYVNGVRVFEATGYLTGYSQVAMKDGSEKTFQKGKNVLAVHCKQTSGGQYIDLGISRQLPSKDEPKRVW